MLSAIFRYRLPCLSKAEPREFDEKVLPRLLALWLGVELFRCIIQKWRVLRASFSKFIIILLHHLTYNGTLVIYSN